MTWTDSGYAYVLGLYLGDGCIARNARTFSLRLSLDTKYPGIIAEARETMEAGFSANGVSEHTENERGSVTVLAVYSAHLPCLFPQHGPGKKHDRAIVLEPWQLEIVARQPWSLIRGLLQSDGCRFVNRTGSYSYPSYDFAQVSDDIKGIFAEACERVGVRYRIYPRRVRVYDRSSVALLDEHVGPKF